MALQKPGVAYENTLDDKLNLINWTPHAITVLNENDEIILAIKPFGYVARLKNKDIPGNDLNINGFSVPVVCKTQFTGFLEPPLIDIKNVIVSMPVADYLLDLYVNSDIGSIHRKYRNIFIPDSGPQSAVRDKEGQIIGVRRLVQYI